MAKSKTCKPSPKVSKQEEHYLQAIPNLQNQKLVKF